MKLSKLHDVEIVIISTVPFFLVNQLSSHIENLVSHGMKVTLVTSQGEELEYFFGNKDIHIVTIEISRNIHLWKDMKTLFQLLSLFRKQHFSIMHSTTPKAGLLCSIAAKLAGTPVRLHTFTGQVWATKRGLMKWILRKMDQTIIYFNTHCYTDSPSQRKLLIDSGIADPDKLSAYGEGSLAGVDLKRFSPERFKSEQKENLKDQIGIKKGAFVLTYIGRLTREKGIYELLSAFELLKQKFPDIVLLMLGPVDEEESEEFLRNAQSISGLHCLGYVSEPEKYLAITDLHCLPSYREGFGTVVVEAAAMGVPTIGTKISGLVDAVVDGQTGLLVPIQDVNALAEAIESLVLDGDHLEKMGSAALSRCEQEFDSNKVNNLVAGEYVRWLEEAQL